MVDIEVQNYIKSLIDRAKKAQAVAENFTQEEVRHFAACIGWLALNNAEKWRNSIIAKPRWEISRAK